MVLVSHLLSLLLPLFLLHFFLGKSPQAKPLNRGLGTLNLEHIKISMGNKRQVSLALSAWLQTPRGTPQNVRTPSHTTWFHTLLPQWHVFKRLASGKILHFSPSCEHLPTQHTSHLASPAVGHQAPEGSLGQRFTDTPGSKKSTRDSGFFDRDEPRNEAAQLPGQQERPAQREEKQDHRESNQNGYKKPAPSCISTSPAPGRWRPRRGLPRAVRIRFSDCAPHDGASHLPPLIETEVTKHIFPGIFSYLFSFKCNESHPLPNFEDRLFPKRKR